MKTDDLKDTGDQKTTIAEDSLKVPEREQNFDPAKVIEGKELKQGKIASLITGEHNDGGHPGIGVNVAGSRMLGGASGIGEAISGNTSRTTVGVNTRKANGGRFDKKVEKLATNINYQPTENITTEVKHCPRLAESADKVVGYNGSPRSELYVQTKNAGVCEGDSEFLRSCDFVERDMMYFSQGQVIKKYSDANANDMPTLKLEQHNGEYKYLGNNIHIDTDNYYHKALHVKYDGDGNLMDFHFDVDKLHVDVDEEDKTVDASAQNYYTKINLAELDRLDMDKKAGDETQPDWCPIPRAIAESNKIIQYAKDIEAMTGAELLAAKNKMTSAFAFQINKATKDGMDLLTPINEFLTGAYDTKKNQTDYAFTDVRRDIFNSAEYSRGSAALFIALFDSPNKYNNKADFLLQPRSLRMITPMLDNSIKTFKIDPIFNSVFKKREAFSTQDGSYDPAKPILMTDKAGIIHRHNFNELGAVSANKLYIIPDYNSNYDSSTKLADNDVIDVLPVNHEVRDVYGFINAKIYNADGTLRGASSITGVSDASSDIIMLTVDDANLEQGRSIELWFSEEKDDDYSITINGEANTPVTCGSAIMFTIHDDVAKTKKLKFKVASVRSMQDQNVPGYAYSDQRNTYARKMPFFFTEGIIETITRIYGGKIFSLLEYNDSLADTKTWRIPTVHSTRAISAYDLLIAISANEMVLSRSRSMIDFIDYERNHGNALTGIVSMKDVIDIPFDNFGMSDIDHPLTLQAMNGDEMLSWLYPEFLWKMYQSDGGGQSSFTTSDETVTKQLLTTAGSNDNGKYCYFRIQINGENVPVTYDVNSLLLANNVEITLPLDTEGAESSEGTIVVLFADEQPDGFTLVKKSNKPFVVTKGFKVYIKNAAANSITPQTGDTVAAIALPMYDNVLNYYVDDNKVYRDWDQFNTSFPNVRTGLSNPDVEVLTGDARKMRLDADIVTNFVSAFESGNVTGLKEYKYSPVDEGLAVFIVKNPSVSAKTWASLPRQLGWSFVAPARLVTPSVGYRSLATGTNCLGATSHRVYLYNHEGYQPTKTIFARITLPTRPNQIYIQRWNMLQDLFQDDAVTDFAESTDVIICNSQVMTANGQGIRNRTLFTPIANAKTANQGTGAGAVFDLTNRAFALRSMINVLPFMVNPFDAMDLSTGTPLAIDIYEKAQLFGLCGFKACDYSEDFVNRYNYIDQLGRKYVLDYWFIDSRFNN